MSEPRRRPRKLVPGDRVAIVSPSFAAPALFPEVHEVAMETLLRELDLVPVEYPTTRQFQASAEARARDLNDVFADPSIRAVMATIGGDDQITVLPRLDPTLLEHNPPAFFGYSDNTNLHLWLWRHGVSSYHGGSTQVHLARPGGAHRAHLASLRHALFDDGVYEIPSFAAFTDLQPDWGRPETIEHELPTTNDVGWRWHGDHSVTGVTWGGNLEILSWNLATNRWIDENDAYDGAVLLLETSEEMPRSEEVFRMLRNLGERGLLERFAAIVMAKAKAWSREQQLEPAQRDEFRQHQSDVLFQVSGLYAPDAIVVYGPDFGHTDPQLVLPYGALMTVDARTRRIFAQY
ncbi:MAG TPA: LD-carboxypeptidase [Acidimicrobiales bacterium]|nr:LD-carboxypeptidase [Acidimicrobiales bacterium]